MWIIVVCLVGIFAAYMYWVNGRSIFDDHSAPTEAENEVIQEIIAFEQKKLAECTELLLPYHERASELGIEIRPVLDRHRAVNHHGLVESHDFEKDYWLPKFYGSRIFVYIYKDDELLEKRESHNTTRYFVAMFELVTVRKNDNVIDFNQNPFENSYTSFDASITQLLDNVSDFIQ